MGPHNCLRPALLHSWCDSAGGHPAVESGGVIEGAVCGRALCRRASHPWRCAALRHRPPGERAGGGGRQRRGDGGDPSDEHPCCRRLLSLRREEPERRGEPDDARPGACRDHAEAPLHRTGGPVAGLPGLLYRLRGEAVQRQPEAVDGPRQDVQREL